MKNFDSVAVAYSIVTQILEKAEWEIRIRDLEKFIPPVSIMYSKKHTDFVLNDMLMKSD